MQYQGICRKMQASIHRDVSQVNTEMLHYPVDYHFRLDHFKIYLNQLLMKPLTITWTGRIYCIQCGKKTSKSYGQGYCFPCFNQTAAADLCMLKPEICHYHLGTCRDHHFAEQVCFQPHLVYLANSSDLKVGITRATQMPTRWLDQGASQALAIIQVNTRRLSGQLEALFSREIADKSNWRALLKGQNLNIDLKSKQQYYLSYFQHEIEKIKQQQIDEDITILDQAVYYFQYPVLHYPQRVISHNFEKIASIQGVLHGIKGQYLILDTGVINIRKYTGYEIILQHHE